MKLGIIVSKPRNEEAKYSWHAIVQGSIVHIVAPTYIDYYNAIGMWIAYPESIKMGLHKTDFRRIKCTKKNLRAFAKQFK